MKEGQTCSTVAISLLPHTNYSFSWLLRSLFWNLKTLTSHNETLSTLFSSTSTCWESAVNFTARTEADWNAAGLQWFCCTEPWQLLGRNTEEICTMLLILHRHASGRLGKESALEKYFLADGIFIVIANYYLFFLIILLLLLLLRHFYFKSPNNYRWLLLLNTENSSHVLSCFQINVLQFWEKNQFLVF